MKYVLGLDIGTSSAKAAAVTLNGDVAALAHREYDLQSPHSGWSEEDPQLWWDACVQALREVIASLPGGAAGLEAIGVSNQMHSMVVLDEALCSIRPSILHNDARTGAQMRELKAMLGTDAEGLTRNPIVNGMTLPSLLWLRENEPENYARVAHVVLAGDYIRMRLTGTLSTDHSNASATLFYDFDSCGWSKQICNAADIPMAFLPPIFNSCDIAGHVSAACARETGLIEGTPVVFGGADQVMQSIGSGCIYPGQATVNIGSGGQVCVQTETLHSAPEAGVNAFAGYERGRWYMMGANTNGGSAYKWFCRNILQERDYNALNAQIASVRPGADGLIFLPYLNGERCPHRNADISGVFLGMSYHTDRARMARAVMEGVTFSLMDCLQACRQSGCSVNDGMVALGGGTNSRVWLQMQADVYNMPLRITVSREQAVLGAAICAAVGCGAISDMAQACAAFVRYSDEVIYPDPRTHEIYLKYYQAYRDTFAEAKGVLERTTLLGRREDI